MKQNVGASAFIVAALAFAVRTGVPNPHPAGEQAAVAMAPGLAAGNAQPGAANPEPAGDAIEGPWLATRAFFQSSSKPGTPQLKGAAIDLSSSASVRDCARDAADGCRAQMAAYFGISAGMDVEFLLATVPDPLHTRLSLATDSLIRAVAKAADNSSWTFTAQWLPWVDTTDPEEKDPEKRREERAEIRVQEKQPGVLVFRRRAVAGETNIGNSALIVFLVGETPTSGINPAQFQIARAYMRSLSSSGTAEVRIQGPTFSGSFYSLAKLLKDDRTQSPVQLYRVRSGTATSVQDADEIREEPGVDFHGATANSSDQIRYLRSALKDLQIDPSQAALLVEDESAYGQGAVTAAKKNMTSETESETPIRVFRFPRDIADLRNAYRNAVAASGSDKTPSPDIDFSLKDTATGEDSIPIFSGSQSPLSQEGVVNTIADSIRRDDIRLVQVNATNTLDLLFLAEVLKRQCPDTRLMVTFPDDLVIEEAQIEPLEGTLVLASYPAFMVSNSWMGGGQESEPFTFPDANSEGVYNATVLLLNSESDARPLLADYHWRELPHPPTWLLTLDHQGFLPVNVFPHSREEEKNERWFQQISSPDDEATAIRLPRPPPVWSFVSTAISLAALVLCAWIMRISKDPVLEMDARFSLVRIDGENGWRRFYIFGILIVLLAMEITVWSPAWRAEQSTFTEQLRLNLLPAASCIAVVGVAWRLFRQIRPDRPSNRMAWLGIGAAAICAALWLTACIAPDDQSLFFAFRAAEMRFGSSPEWPVIASLAAIGLFAFIHVTRFYYSASQRPDVITNGIPISLEDRLHEAWVDFNGALQSGFGFQSAFRKRSLNGVSFAALAILVVGILFRVDLQMRSIDGADYNLLALILQVFLIVLLLLTTVHIRALWRHLQSFLAALATLPLADSFRNIEKSGTSRPIWVRRLNLQSVDIHVQAIYVLHNMTVLAESAAAADTAHGPYFAGLKVTHEEYAKLLRQILAVDKARTRGETLALMKRIRGVSKSIARQTLIFLHDYWLTTPLAGGEIPSDSGEDEADSEKPAGEGNARDRFAALAQRFVALHYSSFILYGVRQIQNLLLFLSSGFVLLMISLNGYSIQAPHFIGRLLLILFVIIGAATSSALAGLERDSILSRMSGTQPGKLNTSFYLRIAAYGVLPALSVLASEFPAISGFLLSWVQPTLEALK